MGIYGIYDRKYKEQCLLIGTINEVVSYFKMSARAFNYAIRKGNYKNRYEIIYLYEE